MSRVLSDSFLEALHAAQTDELFIYLVEISHDNLSAPIRVNNSGQDITSNGNVYINLPFTFVPPPDSDEGSPRAKLLIDNVSRDIVEAVETMGSAADCVISIVLASDPDVIEVVWPDFELGNFVYDVNTVEGTLSIEDFTAAPYPARVFGPAEFPAL